MAKNWVKCILGDLLESLESGSRPRGGVKDIRSGVPSIGGEHLTYNGSFNFSSIKYVPQDFAKKMNRGIIKPNDILIVKDGATTGKTAFVDGNFPYKDAVVNEHVFVCRPSKLIDPRFLFRFLVSKNGQKEILDNFQGSAQGGINLSFAENTDIPLAPLNEQRRIVEKLEKLLERVESAKARLEKLPVILKRFRQSVLATACSGKLTVDWRGGNSDAECLHENLDFPKTWRILLIEPLLSKTRKGLKTGPFGSMLKKHEHRANGVPVLGIENIGYMQFVNGSKIHITAEKAKQLSGYDAQPGDVLISRSGTVGEVCVVPDGLGESRISTNIMRVVLSDKIILPAFFCYLFNGSPFVLDKVRESCKGSTRNFLNQKILKAINFPLPPLPEQHEIVRRVEALFTIADKIETRYKKAKTFVDSLTQSLLAKAFRGELVPQDPSDEPASVLLERIRGEREKDGKKSVRKKTRDVSLL